MNRAPKCFAMCAISMGVGLISAMFLPPQMLVVILGGAIIVIGIVVLKC